MKAVGILMLLLMVFCLVGVFLSCFLGIHEATYTLPNGDVAILESTADIPLLINGAEIEPQIQDDNTVMLWFCVAGVIIFMTGGVVLLTLDD